MRNTLLTIIFLMTSLIASGQEEAQKAKSDYERALEKYNFAQNQIQHLSEKRKQELVLEDYEYFL